MTKPEIFYTGYVVNKAEAKSLGLSKYFTGQPCKNGHVDQRYVSGGSCVSCLRVSLAKRRMMPDVRERNRVYARSYYSSNKDDILAKQSVARRSDGGARLEYGYKWRMNNAQSANERSAEWAARNPEAVNTKSRHRRALKSGAVGCHKSSDVYSILSSQRFLCAAPWCGRSISNEYDVDHIVPLSRGGSNWPDNLQCLCVSCNRSKGAKTMKEWREWRVVLGLNVDGV